MTKSMATLLKDIREAAGNEYADWSGWDDIKRRIDAELSAIEPEAPPEYECEKCHSKCWLPGYRISCPDAGCPALRTT